MIRVSRFHLIILMILTMMVAGSVAVFGQQVSFARGAAAPTGYGAGQGSALGANFGNYGSVATRYFYPGFGGFGGFLPPFYASFALPPAYPYLPNYWWVSMYNIADPRQEGYNPSSGYPRESVTTLLLDTQPSRARIILDGTFVGRSDYLGPIQLPFGEHSLRVEANGYESSETVLKVEQAIVQQLEIRLSPARPSDRPGPHS